MKRARLGTVFHGIDRTFLVIMAVGMSFRTLFALVSPLADDWINFTRFGIMAYHGSQGGLYGVYTGPAYVFAAFYALWLILPIAHPDPNSIINLLPSPGVVLIPYFQASAEGYTFVLVMKLPSLIFDCLTACLIYRILCDMNVSKHRTYWAVSAWLLNPLTLIVGGFNGFEVIPSFLLLACTYLAAKRRFVFASLALTAGGLLRFLPFLTFPFILANTIRKHDLKAAVKTSVPLVLVLAIVLSLIALTRPSELEALTGSYPGLVVGESIDFLGSVLPTGSTVSSANPVTMTLLAYAILLILLTDRGGSHAISVEAYAPLLAYTAFSWSAPQFMAYVIPFALIQIAAGGAYRTLTVVFSSFGVLWMLVRTPLIIISEVSLFYVPLYSQLLRDLNTAIMPLLQWITIFSVQIRGALSAVLVFLILRLFVQRQRIKG